MKMEMCDASIAISFSASLGNAPPLPSRSALLTAWIQPTSVPSSLLIGRHITSRDLKWNLLSQYGSCPAAFGSADGAFA